MFKVRLSHHGYYTNVFYYGSFDEVFKKVRKFGIPFEIVKLGVC